MVLQREADCSIPKWSAAVAHPEYDKALNAYYAYKGDRVLLCWKLMEGVKVLRLNTGTTQFTDEINNIELPFDALCGRDRSGMYMSVYHSVLNFLNGE